MNVSLFSSRPSLTIGCCLIMLLQGACVSTPRAESAPPHRSGTPRHPAFKQPVALKPPTKPETRSTQTVDSRVQDTAELGGLIAGLVIGVPASVVLAPLTIPLLYRSNLGVLAPFALCYCAGEGVSHVVLAPVAALASLKRDRVSSLAAQTEKPRVR